MATPHDAAILVDNQRAHDHALKYLGAVSSELYARGLILTSAMQKFAKFVDLPESNSKFAAILDLAFTALSLVQPEFFLAKLLGEEEKAVGLALEISAQAGGKGAKIVKGIEKTREIGEKAAKAKEKVVSITEKIDKVREAPEGVSPLGKLDASKGPIKDLIKAYNKALGVWSKALDTLDNELESRLSDSASPGKEPMLVLAKRLLAPPQPFTDNELDQIERLYLWHMIRIWAQRNVVIVATTTHTVGGGVMNVPTPDYKTDQIKGMTDTQKDTIFELFGMFVPRGRIFLTPMVIDLPTTLRQWGVNEEFKTFTSYNMPRAG